MKKVLSLFLIPIFLFCSFSFYTPHKKNRAKSKKVNMEFKKDSINSNRNINLNCVAGIVIDQESGRVLYSKSGERILPMASTTKIITAIVAIENGKLTDKVTVSKKAAAIHGSTVGLKEGEKVSLEELLYGLMLRSGNDAAIAIAEHLGNGKVGNFIEMMNNKAVELGALHTSFATPHGLDNQNHYTTAEDLAKITAYAMKNSMFAKIVSTKEISSGISGSFNRSYGNINKFLYRVDNSDGVKTGYTGNAGKCLVASVKHPYGRYVCVVLNSSDRWKDAEKLARYANENYKFIRIMDKNEKVTRFRIYGGKEKYINGMVDKELYLPMNTSEVNNYSVDIYAPSAIFAPIVAKETLGNIVVTIDSKIVAKYPVKSDREVKRKNILDTIKNVIYLN